MNVYRHILFPLCFFKFAFFSIPILTQNFVYAVEPVQSAVFVLFDLYYDYKQTF